MRLKNIKVRGAIGFKKGLGLDEVEVDFSNLSGLVALAGPNGHGKTTLLECTSPYRAFASREGSLRHHFFLRDSSLDRTFEYDGDLYRSLIKIDSDSDRTEGFLWKNGESMVDGKVTNYDIYINNLLGTRALYYNSIFCAQNSDKISDMRTSELKALFVEFLRLNRLERYETTTKACIGILSGSSQQVERNIANLQERLNTFSSVQEDLTRVANEKVQANTTNSSLLLQIDKGEKVIIALQDTIATNTINRERKTEVETEIQTLRGHMTTKYNLSLDEESTATSNISSKTTELDKANAVLQKKDVILQASDKALQVEKDIARVRKCIETQGRSLDDLYLQDNTKGTEIHDTRNALMVARNDEKMSALDDEIDRANADAKKYKEAIKAMEQEKAEAGQSFDLVRIDGDIRAAKKSMSLLEKRDPACTSTTCSFIVSALQAKEDLERLETEKKNLIADIEKEQVRLSADIEEHGITLGKIMDYTEVLAWKYHHLKIANDEEITLLSLHLKGLEATKNTFQESIARLRKEREAKQFLLDNDLLPSLEKHKALAQQLPEIQKAEIQAEQLSKEIKGMQDALQEKKDRYNQAALEDRSRLRKLEARLGEIVELINEDAEKELAQARTAVADNKNKLEIEAEKQERLSQQLAVLETKLEEKKAAEAELLKAQSELGEIHSEIAQWQYLKYACGKTGLQALEIDGVAPLITGYANDLLCSSFGPNFSVRLVTQDPETGKEVLDIVVIRGDGSETHLENLSGGEKVWVLKSLRLAMTLISKEKSGRNFKTIFCDEEDGALDSEKALSFIGLYKAIQQVGGFDTCFYISHNQDVVGMADHRIEFSGKGIRVV